MSFDTRLVLVRHGETVWTESKKIHGRLDAPLSAAGERHAAKAARRLRSERFAALYSSPRGRALQTAAILGKSVGLTPQPVEELEEMDYGLLEGRSLRLFEPDGTGAWLLRPLVALTIMLTGEKPTHMRDRVARAVETLVRCHPSDSLLVVTHWSVLGLLMSLLIEGESRDWRAYGPWAACGITELQARQGTWEVVRMNDSDHLRDEGPSA
jgi:probable phosphoglycerate mutase